MSITWDDFYKWIELNGFHIYKDSNVFLHSKFITAFDPMEDADSGEIEDTIQRIKYIAMYREFKGDL